jgi:hypothetical protein
LPDLQSMASRDGRMVPTCDDIVALRALKVAEQEKPR